jgi:hypothetical protein
LRSTALRSQNCQRKGAGGRLCATCGCVSRCVLLSKQLVVELVVCDDECVYVDDSGSSMSSRHAHHTHTFCNTLFVAEIVYQNHRFTTDTQTLGPLKGSSELKEVQGTRLNFKKFFFFYFQPDSCAFRSGPLEHSLGPLLGGSFLSIPVWINKLSASSSRSSLPSI